MSGGDTVFGKVRQIKWQNAMFEIFWSDSAGRHHLSVPPRIIFWSDAIKVRLGLATAANHGMGRNNYITTARPVSKNRRRKQSSPTVLCRSLIVCPDFLFCWHQPRAITFTATRGLCHLDINKHLLKSVSKVDICRKTTVQETLVDMFKDTWGYFHQSLLHQNLANIYCGDWVLIRLERIRK